MSRMLCSVPDQEIKCNILKPLVFITQLRLPLTLHCPSAQNIQNLKLQGAIWTLDSYWMIDTAQYNFFCEWSVKSKEQTEKLIISTRGKHFKKLISYWWYVKKFLVLVIDVTILQCSVISNCLEYAILSVRSSVRPWPKWRTPSFSNAPLYWMFRDRYIFTDTWSAPPHLTFKKRPLTKTAVTL